MTENPRKISFWLVAGVAIAPHIFAWFLLRQGYSQKARAISFGYLAFFALIYFTSPLFKDQKSTIEPSVSASAPKGLENAQANPLITSSAKAVASPACDVGSSTPSKRFIPVSSDLVLRGGPSNDSKKLINEKSTAAFKETHYLTVSNTVILEQKCVNQEWSFVQVVEPAHLSESHKGWVQTKMLRRQELDSNGKRLITEADVGWDSDTSKHKALVVAGLNKVHRENPGCATIDTGMVTLSKSKSTAQNPVFFVPCGESGKSFNAFFSKSDVANQVRLDGAHLPRNQAIALCESHVKSRSTVPSSVDFSNGYSLQVIEHPNGRTTVNSYFTSKSPLGVEGKSKVRCLLDKSGLIEADISDAK